MSLQEGLCEASVYDASHLVSHSAGSEQWVAVPLHCDAWHEDPALQDGPLRSRGRSLGSCEPTDSPWACVTRIKVAKVARWRKKQAASPWEWECFTRTKAARAGSTAKSSGSGSVCTWCEGVVFEAACVELLVLSCSTMTLLQPMHSKNCTSSTCEHHPYTVHTLQL